MAETSVVPKTSKEMEIFEQIGNVKARLTQELDEDATKAAVVLKREAREGYAAMRKMYGEASDYLERTWKAMIRAVATSKGLKEIEDAIIKPLEADIQLVKNMDGVLADEDPFDHPAAAAATA